MAKGYYNCGCIERFTGPHESEWVKRCEAHAGQPKTLGKAFYMRELGELLAILHRDGGQYLSEHGWEKATADAKQIASDAVVT